MTYTHPLDLHIKETAIKAFIRQKDQLDAPWKPKKSFMTPHLEYCRALVEGINTEDDRCDYTEWDRRLEICLESMKLSRQISNLLSHSV